MQKPPKDTRRPNNAESGNNNLITPRIIIVCVCLAVAMLTAWLIHTYRKEQKAIKQMQEEIKETYSPCSVCTACGKCKRKEVKNDGREQDPN